MIKKAEKIYELGNHSHENGPQSLRDKVYDYLCDKMHRGELLPGAIIDQKKICSELVISRTPLNNALIRLEAEGIVIIHPRSRVVVNKLEEEDIQYLYEVIGTIEGNLIAKGFPNYTPDVLDEMESWNKQMMIYIENGDLRAYDPLHYQFHQVFVLLAPNKCAERILNPIKNRLWDFPKKSFPQQWYLDACAEHQYIVDALRERNLDKAVSCLKNVHWGFKLNKKYIQMAYYL
jgi:DNA-binding GntR family transcriptional regulator